ncbi:MAG: hypothetical protein Kow00124_00500 [Anaerolineae bacterium]
MASAEIDRLYREGVAALRAGDKQAAREKLMKVVELDETHEQAWLWLSACVTAREEQIICLENVLTINPTNPHALKGLRKIDPGNPKLADAPPEPAPQPSPPPQPVARPAVVDESRDRLIAGVDAPPGREPSAPDSEAWRQPLARQAAAPPPALDDLDRPELPEGADTSLLNLFDAWVAAMFFGRRGAYDVEMRIANFSRIFFNLVFAGVLSGIITALTYVLVLTPLGGIEGVLRLAEMPTDSQTLQAMTAFLNRLGVLSALINVLGIVVGRLLYGFIVSAIAGRMGAKGELVQTIHALSISTVVQQIVLLIPVLLLVAAVLLDMPFGAILPILSLLSLLYSLYQIALDVAAVSAANPGLGAWRSFLSLLLTGIALSGIFCCLSVVISFLAGFAGAL